MQRREFIVSTLVLGLGSNLLVRAAEKTPEIKPDQVLKDGAKANITGYCEDTGNKNSKKFCPSARGQCKECMFYNMDGKSAGKSKGKDVAKCTLLTDPKKPQYVYATGTCDTFNKKT